MIEPKAAQYPRITEFPRDIPRNRIPSPYVNPPNPHSNPSINVNQNEVGSVDRIIAAKPGIVK